MSSRSGLEKKIIEKAWKDKEFKQKLLKDPKAAIQEELGVAIPDGVEIKVAQETADTYYLVLPAEPVDAGTGSGDVEPLAYS